MRKKIVCICVALLSAMSTLQMVATAENVTIAPDFDPVENAQLNETVGDTDGCTAVIDDITLEELVASGEPISTVENVGESSFTLGLARDASVHVITSSDVGWVQSGSSWYYYDSLGNMVTGWLKDGTGSLATWYFCNLYTGVMLSNERAMIDGDYYYFQSDGAMKTGWQEFSDGWYYFTPIGQSEPEGSAVNGRVLIGSEIYLFINYVMQHGKVEFSYSTAGFAEGIYYFGDPGDEDSGCMMYGWLHDTEVSNNTWYYLGTNGRAYTGWYIISGTTYHFDSEAEMSYGEFDMGYSHYVFDSSGAWVEDYPYQRTDTAAGLNLRLQKISIDNYGHRVGNFSLYNAEVTGNLANIISDAVNYYDNNAKGSNDNESIINAYMTNSPYSADIIVYSSAFTMWDYGPNTTATTLTCNEEGQWVYGRSPLEYSEYFVEEGLGTLTTGLIYQSAIVLNESFFNTYNDDTWTEVIRHEMGHAIGLRHPWETSEYPNGNYPEDPA